MSLFDSIKDWTYTFIIGVCVVSYWRGTWILLDILTCDQPTTASLAGGDSFCWLVQALYDPGPDSDYWDVRLKSALITYCTGWALLLIAVISLWSGSWYRRSPDDPIGRVTKYRAFVRWLIVYLFGASAVCLWHGIWYWADAWILPASPVASYWTTSLVGSTAAFLVCGGNALLAPPAIFIIDGPGHNPPPIGVTLLSSYHSITIPYNERPPKLRTRVIFIDIFCSFAGLPFAVVWFWRGSWMVLDNYLWGFVSESTHIHYSILWGFLLAVAFIGITSEPVVARLTKKVNNRHVLGAAGRLRTYILAWGSVSFWRCVWYIWDELSGTHWKTALSSHVIGLVVLTIMGCVSSIAAPASTMGVDAIPHKNCADEPLFSLVPVPFEKIYAFAIGRQVIEEREDVTEKVTDHDLVERTYREVEFRNFAEKVQEGANKESSPDEGVSPSAAEVDAQVEKNPEITSATSKVSGSVLGFTSMLLRESHLNSITSENLAWLTDEDGLGSAYHELQRPNLSVRRSLNDSADARRLRSSFTRSR